MPGTPRDRTLEGCLTGVYTCAMDCATGSGSEGCSSGGWELSAGPGSDVARGGCGGGGDRPVAGEAGLTAGAGSGRTGARGVATGSACGNPLLDWCCSLRLISMSISLIHLSTTTD